MSFVHPALAFGALLGLLPPLLHLLDRRRPRTHPFAAIDFLLKARRGGERSFRLRRLLLMVARMALLALVPLALARPRLGSTAQAAVIEGGPRAVALIVDGSGSMDYRHGGKPLFHAAVQEAQRHLGSLSVEEPATVMLCAPQAPDPLPPGGERAELLERLRSFTASSEPADLSACIEKAAQALSLSDVPHKRIEVFTDLQQNAWDLQRPAPTVATAKGPVRVELQVTDVAPGPMPNLALQDLAITPSAAVGQHGYQFSFVVRNFSDQPVANVPVALGVEGHIAAQGFCDVPAFGSQRKILAATLTPGTVAEGRISLPQDSLPSDDTLTFVVSVPRQVRVLLVNGAPSGLRYLDEAFFVQTALEAAGRIAVQTVDPEGLDPAAIDSEGQDVIALLDVRSLPKDVSAALRRFVERGGGLLVSAGNQVDPDALNDALGGLLPSALRLVKTAAPPPVLAQPALPEIAEEPTGTITSQAPARFARVDFTSPVFSSFSGGGSEGLLDTRIYRYLLVEPPPKDAQVIASYDDGAPALLWAQRKAGRVLLFTSSLAREWTDWPIRPSFVPAVREAVLFLAHLPQGEVPRLATVGQTRRYAAGAPAPLSVRSPTGHEVAIEHFPSGERGFRLSEVGLYRVQMADETGRRNESRAFDLPVAFDPKESDTRRIDPREILARYGGSVQTESQSEAVSRGETPIWSKLLLWAAALLGMEALLAA